jgi:hypothetical protein
VTVEVGLLRGGEGRRHPELLAVGGQIERGRHDAEDRARASAQADLGADDTSIATEHASPEPVAEHHHIVSSRLLFGLAEDPPERGRNAEDVEVRAGDAHADDALGRLALGDVEVVPLQRGQPDEGVVAAGPLGEVAGRYAAALEHPPGLEEIREPMRLLHGQRAEHHGVDDAEDGGRAADAEGQRQRGDAGEPGVLPQLSQAEAQILAQLREVLVSQHDAIPFLSQLLTDGPGASEVAESVVDGAARLLRRQPERHVLAQAHLAMEGELTVDLVFDRRLPEPRAQEQATHDRGPSARRLEQDAGNRAREDLPGLGLAPQPGPPGRGQAIGLDPAPELRFAPLGLDPSPLLHAIERRIERPVFDVEGVADGLFEPSGDGVAMPWSARERLEHEDVQRAMEERVRRLVRRHQITR